MTCTEFEELSGAYVLDAITPEEREAADAHLAQCPHCTQLVREMRSAVEFLPLAVPQVAPPPQLKGRILAAVQAASAASSQSTQDVQAVRPLQAQPMRERPTAPTPVPIRRRAAATQRWAMPLVAAAAVLFVMLSGGLAAWNFSLQHQVASLQANAITTTTYAIRGTTNANVTGEAKHISGDGVDVTVVTVRGLPVLQNQQVYQGWEIQGSQAKSVGLLNVQSDGIATINIPGDVKGNNAVAVSIEKGPRATPNAPKGPIVAKGNIV